MNFIRRFVFAAAAVMALAPAPAAVAQKLLGNTFGGTLYDVDFTTGALSNARPVGTGGESLMGISFGPGYQLHGLTTFVGTPPNALVFISEGTGAATTIGATGFSTMAEGDLAFDLSTGVLYGLQNIGSDSRELITINPLTGAGTVVGSLGVNASGDFSAMAFGPGGELYVLDTGLEGGGSRLLTVNKATAAITSAVALSKDLDYTAGLAFNTVTGTLYVADGGMPGVAHGLYTLNPTTGVVTLVGSLSVAEGLAGLAFVVPEPTGAGLAMLAGLMALVSRAPLKTRNVPQANRRR